MLTRFSSAWIVILFAAGQLCGQAATSSPAASSTPATSSTSTAAAVPADPGGCGGHDWHAAGDAPGRRNVSEAAAGSSSPATGDAAQSPVAAAPLDRFPSVATGSTALPNEAARSGASTTSAPTRSA